MVLYTGFVTKIVLLVVVIAVHRCLSRCRAVPTESRSFLFLTSPCQQEKAGGAPEAGRGHRAADQTAQRDVPYLMGSCSVIKAGVKREEGAHSELRHLSSQVTITDDRALLSKQLNICLPLACSE